jgi:hypothetical protein
VSTRLVGGSKHAYMISGAESLGVPGVHQVEVQVARVVLTALI